MDERAPRRYFVVVRYGGNTPIIDRLGASLENMKEILSRVSGNEYQLAFTAQDASCVGFFFKTKLNARQVHQRLCNAEQMGIGNSVVSDDEVLVVEIGEDFSGQHFTRAWTWLQHH